MKTKKTTNYNLFELAAENRFIDDAHVRKLKRSIEAENLLECTPIIVTPEYVVIDGQHRLQAAKELGVPIYYVVHDNMSFSTMTVLNTTSKNWTLLDFANAYAVKGNKSYTYVLQLCDELKMNVSTALRLLLNKRVVSDRSGSHVTPTATFKEGKLSLSLADFIRARETGSKILSLSDYVKSCRSAIFVTTMMRLFENPEFDLDRLESQLFNTQKELASRGTIKDYLRDIEDVYNFGKTTKNRIRLYEV